MKEFMLALTKAQADLGFLKTGNDLVIDFAIFSYSRREGFGGL
jgi:hypothetical protein